MNTENGRTETSCVKCFISEIWNIVIGRIDTCVRGSWIVGRWTGAHVEVKAKEKWKNLDFTVVMKVPPRGCSESVVMQQPGGEKWRKAPLDRVKERPSGCGRRKWPFLFAVESPSDVIFLIDITLHPLCTQRWKTFIHYTLGASWGFIRNLCGCPLMSIIYITNIIGALTSLSAAVM